MFKKITAVTMALIGIAIVFLGVSIGKNTANHSVEENTFRYSAEEYDLPYAAFGADFYTDIYEGSDYIVDVLNDINKSNETIVKAENAIYEAAAANIDAVDDLNNSINKIGGMIVIAIGLGVFALGLNSIAAAFDGAKKKEDVVENGKTDVEETEREDVVEISDEN